ncbi:MAG: glycosyl hydrolase family 18 protein [Oscillospiraceae bacterium]|nr:glycosyl hydrolase family 18 protein [Oscillospiraceae bacterium]
MRPVLSGYWQSWNLPGRDRVPITSVPTLYNEVIIAFVAPDSQGVVKFAGPDVPLRDNVRYLQSRGQKVLLSIGGGGVTVTLDTPDKVRRFGESLYQLCVNLGVDGIDIDVEEGMAVSGSPWHPTGTVKGVIDGVDAVMHSFPQGFMLTMAPETLNLVGAIARYGGAWGNYLPIILHFGNRITRVHMQYYNSGSMFGVDRRPHNVGTIDFIVYLTEAIIKGFPIADTGVVFPGLPPNKVSVGLPATPRAAYNGYLTNAEINEAFRRLVTGFRGNDVMCSTPYNCLGGLMTWSVQWDATNNYDFARNAQYNVLPMLSR